MARRRSGSRKRSSDRGPDARHAHSAVINHWVGPTLQDKIVAKARDTLTDAYEYEDDTRARLLGRVEGMAIALAILRQSKAKDELERIKNG